MAKLELEKITRAGAAPAPGGNSFLKDANATINNLKDLIKLAQSIQGGPAPAADAGEPHRPAARLPLPPPPAPAPAPPPRLVARLAIAAALDEAIGAGLGEKTVGELLELARPLTVKQLREFVK